MKRVGEDDLKRIRSNTTPLATQKNTDWSLRTYLRWVSERAEYSAQSKESIPQNFDDLIII